VSIDLMLWPSGPILAEICPFKEAICAVSGLDQASFKVVVQSISGGLYHAL
jgi:hypothetical protein